MTFAKMKSCNITLRKLRHRRQTNGQTIKQLKTLEHTVPYFDLFYIHTNEHRLRGHTKADRKKHKDEIMIHVGIQLC